MSISPDPSPHSRVAFTPEDRQLLAEYLFKLPEHKRSAPSNFQEIAKRVSALAAVVSPSS